jgi:hypothetical protein
MIDGKKQAAELARRFLKAMGFGRFALHCGAAAPARADMIALCSYPAASSEPLDSDRSSIEHLLTPSAPGHRGSVPPPGSDESRYDWA